MLGIIFILAVLAVIMVIIYNNLVSKNNQVSNAFASTDALLKKRYDLIPNLVSSVKAYMEHEKGLLTEITELRSKVAYAQSEKERVDLENNISHVLGNIMVAVENYPNLKANENFLQLQRSLNEIEEQVSAARRAYNASVTELNNAIQMFPTKMIASFLGFKERPLFEISPQERQNVGVAGLFKN